MGNAGPRTSPTPVGGGAEAPATLAAFGTSIEDGVRAHFADRTMSASSATRTTKCIAATILGITWTARRQSNAVGIAEVLSSSISREGRVQAGLGYIASSSFCALTHPRGALVQSAFIDLYRMMSRIE